jgi:hypothetical protein
LRVEFGEEGVMKGVEALGGLTVEDDGFREQAVNKAVARGGQEALRRDRTVGLGTVDSVCVDLTFG